MARALGPERLGGLSVTGLDPNPEMQPFCREAAAAAGLAPGQLALVEGGAEAMPFGDSEFDAAVITLVRGPAPRAGAQRGVGGTHALCTAASPASHVLCATKAPPLPPPPLHLPATPRSCAPCRRRLRRWPR